MSGQLLRDCIDEEVQPCPKCGGVEIRQILNWKHLYHIWCSDCYYGVSRRFFPDAVKFWNGLKR